MNVLKIARQLLRISKLLISTIGYGVWILPDGKVERVLYHDEFLMKYFKNKNIKTVNKKARSQGWIRVLFSQVNKELIN